MRDSNSRKCLSSCQGGSWKTASIRLMFAILETTWHDVILLDHLWHNLYSVQISQKISHLCRGKKQKPQTHALLICYRTLGRQALFTVLREKGEKRGKLNYELRRVNTDCFQTRYFSCDMQKCFEMFASISNCAPPKEKMERSIFLVRFYMGSNWFRFYSV